AETNALCELGEDSRACVIPAVREIEQLFGGDQMVEMKPTGRCAAVAALAAGRSEEFLEAGFIRPPGAWPWHAALLGAPVPRIRRPVTGQAFLGVPPLLMAGGHAESVLRSPRVSAPPGAADGLCFG